jgi:hypothetical protein
MTDQTLFSSSRIKEVALNCRLFSINGMLPAGFMQGIEAETFQTLAGEMCLRLCKHIYAEEKVEQIDVSFTYSIPANWLEHLKQALAPTWVKSHWPVKMAEMTVSRRVDLTQYMLYPSLPEPEGRPAVLKMVVFQRDQNLPVPIHSRRN